MAGSRQSGALGSCSPGAAAVHAGLAAVAVNRAALIRELARTDFLTIRVQYSEIAVIWKLLN